MNRWFHVSDLDIENLLAEWRWLCPNKMSLVARTAFGDLFLENDLGNILWLNATEGKLTEVAQAKSQFLEMCVAKEEQDEWFAESDFKEGLAKGLNPASTECIAFSIPLVLAANGAPNKPYLANIYECLSFLGHFHRQICKIPDGAKVKFQVTPPKQI